MLPNGPYNPQESEKEILDFWLSNKLYKPEYDPKENRVKSTEEMKSDSREAWSLICPPPNAYARPHIGNISGYAYQDAMARYQRMHGKKVLVLPGKDHAGLEGEGVFVREVLEKQGRNKFDMKREDFYAEMMEFFMKNIDIARKDEREIGLSADFDRDIFTLDPRIVDTVLNTFIAMYEKRMIYKGVRIVNWDPKARTAVADNQIEYKDAETPFVYFKYGFLEPEKEAIKIKEEFRDKNIKWKYERSVSSKGEELPFAIGALLQDYQIETGGLKISALGYDTLKEGELYEGKSLGVLMRLDKKFRLIVINPEFKGDIQEEIAKLFLFEVVRAAGAHPILFNEYPEDKFYNNGFILGTVRPETKFGDTAIAVDPKDERYKEWVGKIIQVKTLIGTASLNIISDYAVDMNFGTGVVKVTPAHSPTDWEIAQRHPEECLPPKQVIGYDLTLNKLTGKYAGMKIKDARKVIVEDMKTEGILIYINEKYQNRIQIAERTKAPIEPLLSSQWYLKYDGIKEAAIDMVKSGEVKIHPKNMEQKFNHWMENLRDWAISRSLWWGYRLPVWYAGKVREVVDENGQVKEEIQLENEWTPIEYSNPDHLRVQLESPGSTWLQDESVLDTWFSSGQWVYATLGAFDLMDTFFPTNVLVSASDILENWDSRMMMFTYFHENNIPFKNLFLTGLVLGKDGQKMSKSKGNVMDVDQIKNQYGSDALRMSYFYQNSAGGSYVISDDKLKNFKQFNNKIWNAAKFVLNAYEELNKEFYLPNRADLEPVAARKLWSHIEDIKTRVTKNIEDFEFGHATDTLYHNFWHEFCDILIELSKGYTKEITNKATGEVSIPHPEERENTIMLLVYTLKEYLKMLHPFIPFITERIWKEVPKTEDDHESLMYSKW